ncbi:hypothetical protein GCM10009623_10060 [Nocardioides aestuarii]|uniref:DUF4307 domain-containing protein n=1 Tax=Nocardioides aestuarii TaxID=252231 RepID=A0ABW4TKJ1_9ACTN
MTTDLSERYGAPSPTGRRIVLATVGVVVLAFAGWLAWTTLFHATPAVSSEIGGWEVVDDGSVDVTVSVKLEDGVVASCSVRAYAEDHTTVGELAFEPVDGRNQVTLRTERRATSVTLLGCTAPGQPRPR